MYKFGTRRSPGGPTRGDEQRPLSIAMGYVTQNK